MQTNPLKALNGNLGSASKYHKEEVTEFKNQNSPSSRYYINEPDSIAQIFDRGGLLKKYLKNDSEVLDAKLAAIEEALKDNLDKKSKSALKKHQSKKFARHRSEIYKLQCEIKDKGRSYEQRIIAKENLKKLLAEVEKVPSPMIGRDFTFTVEKSFSIAFALADQKQKQIWIKAFQESCQESFEHLLKNYLRTNSKKTDKEIEDVLQKVVYGMYTHFQNRDGDPHLHMHAVLYNLLKDVDGGRLKGINFPILFGSGFTNFCKEMDTMLHMKLKEKIEEKIPNKYVFVPYKMKNGKRVALDNEPIFMAEGWDVGFDEPSKKKIKSLAKLSVKVDEAIKEKIEEAKNNRDIGISATELLIPILDSVEIQDRLHQIKVEYEAKVKWIKTELAKEFRSEIKPEKGEVKGDFESIADQLKLLVPERTADEKKNNLEQFVKDFGKIIAHLTANKHSFTTEEVVLAGLKYHSNYEDVYKLVVKKLKEDTFPGKKVRSYMARGGKWFSKANLAMASIVVKSSIELSNSGWGKKFKPLALQEIERLKAKGMNQDQIAAVYKSLEDTRLFVIAGLPGVGKSTVLKEIVDQYKARDNNLEFINLSTSGKIVEQLQEDLKTGTSLNFAQFASDVEKGKITLTNNSVVIVDEAGMVEDKHFYTLLNKAKEAGAKVILVGDDRQLSSVGRGDSFTDILKYNQSTTVRIGEIVRQKNAQLKEIVSDLAGSTLTDKEYLDKVKNNSLVVRAIERLEKIGAVKTFYKSREVFENIAKDYVDSNLSADQKLVIAASNRDVSKINNAIQNLLFKDTDTPFISLDDSDLSFYVGDRIMVKSQIKETKLVSDPKDPTKQIEKTEVVANGKLGTVLSIDHKKKLLYVEFINDGIKSVKKIDLEKSGENLSLGYACTVHKAQGLSVDNVFLAMSDNHFLNSTENLNVAVSRGKQSTVMYMVGQHKDKIIGSHSKGNEDKALVKEARQEMIEGQVEKLDLVQPIKTMSKDEINKKIEEETRLAQEAQERERLKKEAQRKQERDEMNETLAHIDHSIYYYLGGSAAKLFKAKYEGGQYSIKPNYFVDQDLLINVSKDVDNLIFSIVELFNSIYVPTLQTKKSDGTYSYAIDQTKYFAPPEERAKLISGILHSIKSIKEYAEKYSYSTTYGVDTSVIERIAQVLKNEYTPQKPIVKQPVLEKKFPTLGM